MSQVNAPATLDNCDSEPIHVPGSIQPHGALLAFDLAGRLTHASDNAAALLGTSLPFGLAATRDTFSSRGVPRPEVHQAIQDGLNRTRAARSVAAEINGSAFDVVLHRDGDTLICEFERREEGTDLSSFAQLAFNSLEELKRCASIDELLGLAVTSVRDLTGFDRVMAYRFAHDDSGEVIAEAKLDTLDAYLGRRYPASDIPAQARRLYVLNTLRLIADVAYRPVPLAAAPGTSGPLDLSHSVLRSVSPIHVEYLTNMGVHASMSVSIVIGGRLWGMIACHHLARKVVPHPVRMAVDVMAQVVAATVQSITATQRESALGQAATTRAHIASAISGGIDIVELVRRDGEMLREALSADAIMMSLDGVPRVNASVDEPWARSLSEWLAARDHNLVHVAVGSELPGWNEEVAREDRFCGVLALRFDDVRQGWLVALRRERELTIRWGGKPDKVIAHGPLGPRLTPRGSFEEWREVVKGTATPWNAIQLDIASQLLESMSRAYAARVIEQDALRAQVWAILGHDLRNPLQSINMANIAIERGLDASRLNQVIRNSTVRMNRLLSDVLDMSRLQHGQPLTIAMEDIDLVTLLRQLVDETVLAHPAISLSADLPPALPMRGDPGRLAQLFSNLLSNARHHGQGDVALAAWREGEAAVVSVRNRSEPIPPEVAARLFDPFKHASMNNQRNRSGMGLGLYIASKVAAGHGGTLRYEPGDGEVAFVVALPFAPQAPTPG